MSSSDHNPRTTPPNHWTPVFDELRWVIQIRRSLDEEVDDHEADGVPVSILNVPKPLLLTKPEAYQPQMIALGPYHHWQPELYEMEKYKLSAAKRIQKYLTISKFQDMVSAIGKHEHLIRAHYHRHLDFNGETLSWMMGVDACFLLEFLQIHLENDQAKTLKKLPSRMSHLVDLSGRKSAHNIILRDTMMLENQIPLFLLRKILTWQCGEVKGDEMLNNILQVFMKELSPLKTMDSLPTIDDAAKHCSHLLEVLYYVLVPKNGNQDDEGDIEEEVTEGGNDEMFLNKDNMGSGDDGRGHVKNLMNTLWTMISNLSNVAIVQYVKKAATSKPVTLIVKAPWTMLTTIPGFAVLAKPVESFFSTESDDRDKRVDDHPTTDAKKPPLVEEIMIPSVHELIDAGIRMRPIHGDLTAIAFDPKTATLSLPVVTLDANTEVVLRNLVAFEASTASGPLVLTRYTELMNGIIDTDDDVRLLRESGVVLNRMKSDTKVADMWNSMNRSIRLTKVDFMDRTIEDVNRYYNGKLKVKADRFMKKYVFGSWPLLTFVAAIVMLVLTALQSFCSVYTCARWWSNVPVVGQKQ